MTVGPYTKTTVKCVGCTHYFVRRVYLPTDYDHFDIGASPDCRDDGYCRTFGDERRTEERFDNTPKWCPFYPKEFP